MSSSTREVVTLQIGHYSNFVGTHWWNIQESSFVYNPNDAVGQKEINHDVLFREGQNLQGDITYTPRLIAFDLKGSLHTLKEEGILYEAADQYDDLKWVNDVTLHKSEGLPKNEFLKDLEKQDGGAMDTDTVKQSSQDEMDIEVKSDIEQPQVFGKKLYNLDDAVNVWSDYLRLHLHPKSIHIVEDYRHNSEQVFDVFGYGQQAISSQKAKNDIEDKLHFFLEECDNLQGIQIIVDDYNGFGGIASNVAMELNDEFSGKSIMTFAVSPSSFPDSTSQNDSHRILTTALSYVNLCSYSSLLLPLSTASGLWRKPSVPVVWPHLNYNSDLLYHSSAIIGASLDTMSMPYRLESNNSLASQLANAITPLGRKVVALQSSMPFPLKDNQTLTKCLQLMGDKLPWQPLTPMCFTHTLPTAQSVVLRGIPKTQIEGGHEKVRIRYVSQYSSIDEILERHLSEICCNTLNAGTIVKQPLKVTAPFPHIFSPKVSSTGLLCKAERTSQQGVENIPMMTSLQSTPSVGGLLLKLHEEASRIDIHKFHKFTEAGLEVDELAQVLESMLTMAHNYEQPSDMETT